LICTNKLLITAVTSSSIGSAKYKRVVEISVISFRNGSIKSRWRNSGWDNNIVSIELSTKDEVACNLARRSRDSWCRWSGRSLYKNRCASKPTTARSYLNCAQLIWSSANQSQRYGIIEVIGNDSGRSSNNSSLARKISTTSRIDG